MPDQVNYKIFEVPLLGRNLAASRSPRLQPSCGEEYGAMLSDEVGRGNWSVDATTGDPINSSGQTLQEHLEFTISTRPHWLMPQVLEDEAEKTWTSGNLTLQGRRLKQLEEFCNGSKAAALVMLTEEAERFGVKPFTTAVGVKPGSKDGGEKKPAQENLSTNPWSKSYRGDEAARDAQIASILKMKGTKLAENLARAARTTVLRPLRK